MSIKKLFVSAIAICAIVCLFLFALVLATPKQVSFTAPAAYEAVASNEAGLSLPNFVSQPEALSLSEEEPKIEDVAPQVQPSQVLPAFKYNLARLRSLKAEDLKKELFAPAELIGKMSADELAQIAIDDPSQLAVADGKRFQYSLYGYWFGQALRTGEDLSQANIEAFQQERNPKLWELHVRNLNHDVIYPALGPAPMQPETTAAFSERNAYKEALKGFEAQSAEYVLRQSQAQRTIDACLSYLWRYDPEKSKLDVSDPSYEPGNPEQVLMVLAVAAHKNPKVGKNLFQLVQQPWISKSFKATVLGILVMAVPFEDVSEDLFAFLRSGDSALQWAAVETMCSYADKGEVSAQLLMASIPTEFFQSQDNTLRNATIELIVTFGGEPGRQYLMNMLHDPITFRRGQILGYLAKAGKVGVSDCVQFVTDPEVGPYAVDGLGYLAKENSEAFTELRIIALANNDPLLRARALVVAQHSGQEAAIPLCLECLHDDNSVVQAAAVIAVGDDSEPHLDALNDVIAKSDDATVRHLGYREVMRDISDEDLPSVFQRMTNDNDEQIKLEGIGGLGALARAMPSNVELQTAWQKVRLDPVALKAAGVPAADLPGVSAAADFFGMGQKADSYVDQVLDSYRDPEYGDQVKTWNGITDMAQAKGIDLSQTAKELEFSNRLLRILKESDAAR